MMFKLCFWVSFACLLIQHTFCIYIAYRLELLVCLQLLWDPATKKTYFLNTVRNSSTHCFLKWACLCDQPFWLRVWHHWEKTRQAGGEWGRWWVKQTTKGGKSHVFLHLDQNCKCESMPSCSSCWVPIVKFQFSDYSTVNFEFVHVWTRGRRLTPMRPGSMVRQSERLLGRRLPKDGLQLEFMSKQRSCWHWEGVRVRW